MPHPMKYGEPARLEPYLSVVIPLHTIDSRLPRLIECINDALSKKIQIVLVLDGLLASDEKFPIEFQKLKSDSNFSFIEVNFMNPGESRNAGLQAVNGVWISFWDSDDIPHIDQFLNMCRSADKKRRPIAVGGFRLVNNTPTHSAIQNHPLNRSTVGNLIEILRYPGIWRWSFSRRIIAENKFPASSMGEDLFFLTSLNLSLREIFFSREIVYSYYQWSKTQLTTNSNLKISRQNIGVKRSNLQYLISLNTSLLSRLLILRIFSFTLRKRLRIPDEKS
jgi:glycosyltransferase involved in cell wall biosynthesis